MIDVNKKYKYRCQFVGADGSTHDVSANTKRELKDKVDRLKRDIEDGLEPMRGNNITVSRWARMCFDNYKSDLTKASWDTQWSCFDKWVNKRIGKCAVKNVRELDCQAVLNDAEGLASYTLRRIAQLMYFVFDKAVKNHIIRYNPASDLKIPKGSKSRRRALTKYEEALVIRTVEDNPRYVFFLVMLLAGLRNSEVANLKGKDVITIDGQYFIHVDGTKTESAVRDVPCPDYLRERLPHVSPFEYMFKNQVGGKMTKPNYDKLWRHLKRDMNIKAGARMYRNAVVAPFPVSDDLVSYDLRHTYCTKLMKAGIDIRLAQKFMGHADIRMTADIYSHADTESMVEGAKVLNDVEVAI